MSPGGGLDAPIDLRALTFSVLAVVVTSIVSGVAPALQGGRISLTGALNERSRVGSPAAVRWRKAIVAGQMAFTLVLLIGAGLFVQTLLRLHDQAGFATRNLLMVSIDPPSIGYAAADAERVMREVHRRLRDLPAVERAAVANASLLTGAASMISVTIQADRRMVSSRAVSRMRIGPGFFATLGTPLVAGRDFEERDVRPPGAAPVAYRSVIVNESFARRYFEGRSPIGARLGLSNRPDTPTPIEIIGVVKDFSRRTLREADLDQLFVPFWDQNSGDGTFYVKLRDHSEAAVAAIRATIAEIDPALPITLRAADDQIERSLGTERMLASLSTGFGAIALLLAVVGLYGVMSFVVTQRTQEIGIRMALGATRASALWLVLRDAALDDRGRVSGRAPGGVGAQASRRGATLRRQRLRCSDRRGRERHAGRRSAGRRVAAWLARRVDSSHRGHAAVSHSPTRRLSLVPKASTGSRGRMSSDDVLAYEVTGLPANLAIDVAEMDGRWQLLVVRDGVHGDWQGDFESPDDALAAIERELAGFELGSNRGSHER